MIVGGANTADWEFDEGALQVASKALPESLHT